MSRDLPIRDGSKLSYENDWDPWLPDAVTIDTHAWTISPSGPTLTNADAAIVAVEGVTFGTLYRLTDHIVMSDGQEEERTILLTPVR